MIDRRLLDKCRVRVDERTKEEDSKIIEQLSHLGGHSFIVCG